MRKVTKFVVVVNHRCVFTKMAKMARRRSVVRLEVPVLNQLRDVSVQAYTQVRICVVKNAVIDSLVDLETHCQFAYNFLDQTHFLLV
jgi:hypothetical protein